MKVNLLKLRRKILKTLIPSFFWPKFVSLYNVEIPVRNTNYSTGVKWAIFRKKYEREELYFVNKYIKSTSFVLELGASIGIVTRLISHKIGEKGKLISIEASKRIYEEQKEVLSNLNNTNYIHALGFPCSGINLQRFENHQFEESDSTLGGKLSEKSNQLTRNNIVDLSIIQQGYSSYALVIDIEGAEKILLEEGSDIDEIVNLIIIELHPDIYGPQVELEIIKKISSFGFKKLENEGDVFVFKR
ncbi:FkbM family methyltransferase [Schleiferiaceae bacterium]|nr:FkbM family methyltransferase [Schleiferiaceae bacterium]